MEEGGGNVFLHGNLGDQEKFATTRGGRLAQLQLCTAFLPSCINDLPIRYPYTQRRSTGQHGHWAVYKHLQRLIFGRLEHLQRPIFGRLEHLQRGLFLAV